MFLKKELQQLVMWKDQMAKAQECLFRQPKNLSPFKYILHLIFQVHKQFSTSFWSTKQIERHLTGFSLNITDIIKNTEIEAIFFKQIAVSYQNQNKQHCICRAMLSITHKQWRITV